MHLCDEIKEAKIASANMAHHFAKKAKFGNNTDEMLFDLVRLNTLIGVMCRNETTKKHVQVSATSLQGMTVPLSALKKQNNTLILDLSEPQCLEIEIRPCLSDIEICKVVEQVKLLSYKF